MPTLQQPWEGFNQEQPSTHTRTDNCHRRAACDKRQAGAQQRGMRTPGGQKGDLALAEVNDCGAKRSSE